MRKAEKNFDVVALMRSARDRISADMEGVTLEEELTWLASQDRQDPFSQRLRDSTAQRAARGHA